MALGEKHKSDADGRKDSRPPADHRHRLAVLPSLAARPLIEGLDVSARVELIRAMPGEMMSLLAGDTVEVGMFGPVELQRFARPLVILPAGCISVAGPSLLARVFSRVPPEELRIVWAEAGALSARGLVEVLWAMYYRRHVRLIPFKAGVSTVPADAEAILVTDDRVVADPPFGFDFQIDLGAMWHRLTGLPFVFAAWAATNLAHVELLNEWLAEAWQKAQPDLKKIAHAYGPAYGWPADLAERELTQHIGYDFTEEHIEGLQEFFDLAETVGVIEAAHPIQVATG